MEGKCTHLSSSYLSNRQTKSQSTRTEPTPTGCHGLLPSVGYARHGRQCQICIFSFIAYYLIIQYLFQLTTICWVCVYSNLLSMVGKCDYHLPPRHCNAYSMYDPMNGDNLFVTVTAHSVVHKDVFCRSRERWTFFSHNLWHIFIPFLKLVIWNVYVNLVLD